MKSFDDIVQCYSCTKSMPRHKSIVLEIANKGRFRLCTECYVKYEQQKALKEKEKGNIYDKFAIGYDKDELEHRKRVFLNNLKKIK